MKQVIKSIPLATAYGESDNFFVIGFVNGELDNLN